MVLTLMMPIPSYLKKENDRYVCLGCKKTISTIFADLGCECEGLGHSPNYESILNRIDATIWEIQTMRNITQIEAEYLKGKIQGEL